MTNDKQRERLVELMRNVDTMRLMRKGFSECADYLLANGVIVPPCKVGQTVYWYNSAIQSKPYPMTVTGIADYGEGHMWVYCKNGTDHRQFRASSFGKTVFLTKEEAEAKLKEGVADA